MSPTLLLVALDADPTVVRPGLTPLIVTGLLGVALVLLFFSMRRQVRRIRVPYADGRPADGRPAEVQSTKDEDSAEEPPGEDREADAPARSGDAGG